MLGRLVLPALEPTVDFDFVKAYYARVSDRLHGRVTRLLLTPLLAAFTRLIGKDPYIGYLASFRYALSGEFTIKQLAEMTIELTGSDSKLVYQPLPVDDPTQRQPDITLAKISR